MASVFQIIATPLSYLKIKQPQKKWFDFILPIILSLCLSTLIIFVDVNYKCIELFISNGIVNTINGITQILSGFYLASMAAIATFPNKDMDNIMHGVPPKINGKNLTRRDFLIRLFGYLSFICIFIYFFGSTAVYFSDFINLESYNQLVKFVFCTIYFTIFFNMLFTTSLGLYFTIVKINQTKNEFLPPTNKNK